MSLQAHETLKDSIDSHKNEGKTTIDAINQTVKKLYHTNTPVTTILEVRVVGGPKEVVDHVFDRVNKGVEVSLDINGKIKTQWKNILFARVSNNIALSVNNSLEIVKSIYIRKIIEEINDKLVGGVRVSYLLSSPLDMPLN